SPTPIFCAEGRWARQKLPRESITSVRFSPSPGSFSCKPFQSYLTEAISLTVSSLVALQSGGSDHPWISAYVLCMLFVGAALIAGFVIWEWKGAKYPMVPKDLFVGQRVVAIALAVAFISGMNFYS